MYNTKKEIKNWLDEYDIKNYTINDDLTVDVDGDVEIHIQYLYSIKVKFGIINGIFDCSNNKLNSLEGCPEVVKGHFYCDYNRLKSLKYFPKTIEGDFYFGENPLPYFLYDMSHQEILSYYDNLELQNKLEKELPKNNIVKVRNKI